MVASNKKRAVLTLIGVEPFVQIVGIEILPPIKDIIPPAIKFYTPMYATFTASTRTFNVGVADNVKVVKVEMYRRLSDPPVTVVTGTSLPAIISLQWKNIPIGTWRLTAYAYDAAGNKSLPAVVTVIRK